MFDRKIMMRYLKPFIWITVLCLSFVAQAQTESAIHWTTGLGFKQLMEKAKQENKYVFMDCETTWCVFCKKMDAETYPDKAVGDFFNDKFISVKVQFDQTDKDSAEVKSWYEDAKSISKQYILDRYPTYLVFSPQGEVVHMATGFKTPAQFLEFGKEAIQPGKTYDNPVAKYNKLIEGYKAGERKYDQFLFMQQMADKLQDNDIRKKITRDHADYLATLPREKRYTVEILRLWQNHRFNPKHPIFGFYRDDADIIDKVMDFPGFARSSLDDSVHFIKVDPFFEEQTKLNPNGTEADWPKLEKTLTETYGDKIAQRNLLNARGEWCAMHGDSNGAAKYSLIWLNQYQPDVKSWCNPINATGWHAFLGCTDQKSLKECAQWMEKVVAANPERTDFMDTYASLLYKTGQREKAIEAETQAVARTVPGGFGDFAPTLELMKKNQPIYADYGTNWEGTESSGVNWDGFVFERAVFVKTEDKKPFAGVTVTNKRTNESKTTTEKGKTTINVMLGDVLVVTNAGFASQELKVGKNCRGMLAVLKPGN